MRRLAALAAAGAILSGCSDGEHRARPGATLVRGPLLVSGKDDHGLPAEPRVALRGDPGGSPVAGVRDGTLVDVARERGEWFYVRAVEGPGAQGWVNDFYLRSTVHVVAHDGCGAAAAPAPGRRTRATLAPNIQARLLAIAMRGDRAWVRVRPLNGGADAWVARSAIQELPNVRDCPRAPRAHGVDRPAAPAH